MIESETKQVQEVVGEALQSTSTNTIATHALVPANNDQHEYLWIELTMDEISLVTIVDPISTNATFEHQHTPEFPQVVCWMRQQDTESLEPATKVNRFQKEKMAFSWNTRDFTEYIPTKFVSSRGGVTEHNMQEVSQSTKIEHRKWEMLDIEEAVQNNKVQKAHMTTEQIEDIFLHHGVGENTLEQLTDEEKRGQ